MLKVYSILDDKAQCFNTPYFAQNDLVASRSFSDLCNDSRSLVSQHLGDFHSYCLGEFDNEKGILKPYDMPSFICHAMQYANVERSGAMEIRSRYNAGVPEGWKSSVPSMTQQQFKDEADINYIISMYDSSGVMPTFHGDGQPAQPIFGDFASLPDNAQEMYNRMIEAKNNFDNLPLEVRKRFNYDPAAFLEFVDNPENLDDLVAMGLAVKTVINSDNHTENTDNNTANNADS